MEVEPQRRLADQNSLVKMAKRSGSEKSNAGVLKPKRLNEPTDLTTYQGRVSRCKATASRIRQVSCTLTTELHFSRRDSMMSVTPDCSYKLLTVEIAWARAYSISSATSAGEAGRSSERLRGRPGVFATAPPDFVGTSAEDGEALPASSSLQNVLERMSYEFKAVVAYSVSCFTFVVLLPLAFTTLFTSPSSLVTPPGPALLVRLKGVRRVSKYGAKEELLASRVEFACKCLSRFSTRSSFFESSSLQAISLGRACW